MLHLQDHSWFSHHTLHRTDRHEIGTLMNHIVHDDRFWATIWFIFAIGLIVTLIVIARNVQIEGPATPYEPVFMFPLA